MNIPLFVGEDTSADPRVLQPGQNALVENGRLFNRGQVQKRFGYQSISDQVIDGSLIGSGVQVFSAGTALFQQDAAILRTYSPTNNVWQSLGRKNSGQLTTNGATQTNVSVTESSSANTATLVCVAWAESSSIYVSVLETGTNVQVLPRTQLAATGRSPNVVAMGGDFYIFYVDTSTNLFYARVIRGSSPNAIAGGTLSPASPRSTVLLYDVQAGLYNTGGTTNVPCVLAIMNDYNNPARGAGSGYYTIYALTADLIWHPLTSSTPTQTNPQERPPSIGALTGPNTSTNYIYCNGYDVISSSHGGLGRAFDAGRIAFSPNGNHLAEVILFTAGGAYATGAISFFADINSTAAAVTGGPIWASETGVVATSGLRLASQAFTYNSVTYAWFVSNSNANGGANNQSQWFLIDQAGAIVANALNNGLAAPYDGIGVTLARPTDTGTGAFPFGARYVQQVRSAATGVSYPIGVLVRTLTLSTPHTYAHFVDGVTYLSGPAPQIYDGNIMSEWGFYYYPLASVGHSAGGSTLAGGVYTLYAVYGWYDATGKLWRSGPSAPLTVTIAANETITVTVNYLQTTMKQNAFIEIYCTANVGGQTGVAPFKVGTVANVISPVPPGTALNAGLVASVTTATTFAVTISDLAIASGEPLYTNGGGQLNITPPPTNFVSSSGTRLYLTAGELSQVYATGPAGPGNPLNVFATQAITVPVTDSPINTAIVMDGKLFISTQRFWFVTNADGSASSSTISFNPVRRLAFDTGVSSPPSAFMTLDGIYFQGQRGITLLQRNESLAFVGEVVKNYTDTIVDAYIVPAQEQLRFVQGPRILAYDYQQKGWSQHVFAAVPNIVSACRWNDVGAILRPDGTVMVETPGTFKDDAVAVTRRIETPWIRPGQMGGWGRVWRFLILGERRSAHTLQVKIAYEDDPSYIDTLTISSESVYGQPAFGGGLGTFGRLLPLGVGNPYGANGAGNAYKFEGIMPRSKAGSFKFEISEINSTGEDSALNYLSLLYGVLPNLGQVPTGKKFG